MSSLRSAFRRLYRNPGFSFVAVTTLALALGACAALYAVIEAVLLEPLPYRDADRLVAVWDVNESVGWEKARVTPSHYWVWREQRQIFDQIAIYGTSTHTLHTAGDPLQISGTRVSREYFPLLGLGAARGRLFGELDFASGAPAVAVISHGLWTRVLRSDPQVVGRTLRLDDGSATIVGVLPPQIVPVRAAASGHIDFEPSGPHVWTPFQEVPNRRGSHVFGVLGRLAAGVSPPQAAARLDELAASLPASRDFAVAVVPLVDELTGDVRASLWMLMAAVALVLLVAVLNVGNLVVVRAAARTRELAVRSALGASRWRLLADGLLEGALVTTAAGASGLALGAGLLAALQARPPVEIARLQDATLLAPALPFALPVLMASCLVLGLASLRSSSGPLHRHLGGTGKGAPEKGSSVRLRQLLVALEMAVTAVLVIGSGLLLESFTRLTAVDPGFRNTQVLTVDFLHTAPRYQEMTVLTGFYDSLLAELAAQGEVLSVAASYDHPLTSNWEQSFRVDSPESPESGGVALFRTVTPAYFETLGIGLLEGRTFGAGDVAAATGAVILNQAMSRRYFPSGRALGQELEIGTTQWVWGEAIPTRFTVVGVVEDVRFHGLDQTSEPAFYLPFAQSPQHKMTVYARTRADPDRLLPAVRRIVRRLDPELPIAGSSTMAGVLSDSVAQQRFNLFLVGGFGSCALLLALVGLSGVLSYIARQRLHEIGIRMALGARRQNVVALLLRQGLAPAVSGLAAGTAGAFLLSRLASNLLFEVSPTDASTYAAALAGLLVAAAIFCLGPAFRASGVDPVEILRGG